MDRPRQKLLVVRSQPREDVRLVFPDGTVLAGPRGSTFESFLQAWQSETAALRTPVTAVLCEEVARELSATVERDASVIPLDIGGTYGMRVYKRSLSLVLVAAAKRLFPEAQVEIDHSITANGFFCTVQGRSQLTEAEVASLAAEMMALVRADLPIVRRRIALSEATALFAAQGYHDTVRLLRFHPSADLEVYQLSDLVATFYGIMVPRTGYLPRFRLEHQASGFVLLFPLSEDPDSFPADTGFPQLTYHFREASQWLHKIGAEDVGALNAAISQGSVRQLVLVAEALHERRIGEIAVRIAAQPQVRLVFIAGPSSSGKTTFAKRLGIQLAASGIHSYAVSLDDYFVDRDLTPRDELGELDFENFEAIDHALFSDHMRRLLEGGVVRLPHYDFVSGRRLRGLDVSLPQGTVLLVEGIHGLNPLLLPGVPKEALFRLYVSCLAQINIDHHNYVPTSDARLLRRIVRDALYRGYTAENTIVRWETVRRGERRFVFPFQERADMMFNSSLPHEIAVLKPLVEPLLLRYDHASIASLEAQRLLEMLSHFLGASTDLVPDNSLLREFIGGSIFELVRLTGAARP